MTRPSEHTLRRAGFVLKIEPKYKKLTFYETSRQALTQKEINGNIK